MKPQTVISFFIDELPPSQNDLLVMHWRKRYDLKKRWHFLVNAGARDPKGNLPKMKEPCEALFLFNVMRAMDKDNLQQRPKFILDALVKNGILSDDNPRVVTESKAIQNVVKHRNEQGVLIEMIAAEN